MNARFSNLARVDHAIASLVEYVRGDWVELLGFVFGVATLWLLVVQNIWNWPLGIANNVFYVVVFFQSRLFADMTLQVFFIAVSIAGWYLWLRGGERHDRLLVRRTPPSQMAATLAGGAVATLLWSLLLVRINDAAPLLDAATAVFSIAAQYLMARKYLENWYLWIAIDVVSIGLYAYKHLLLTALLYAIYLAFCAAALVAWNRSLNAAPAVETA